jgi:hypothetical protein
MLASRCFLASITLAGLLIFFTSPSIAGQMSSVIFHLSGRDLPRSAFNPPAGLPQSCREARHAETESASRRESVMKLNFTRSGGFAGPATAIRGEVTFEHEAACVTSDFGYERELPIKEIHELREALTQLAEPQSPGHPLPDQYQYDIQITSNDGHVQNLTFHGDSSPQAKKILDWIREECSRIWSQRMKQAGD